MVTESIIEQQKIKEESRISEFKEKLKIAVDMLRFIDSQFKNKQQRKRFYRDILDNGAVNTSAIKCLLEGFINEKV